MNTNDPQDIATFVPSSMANLPEVKVYRVTYEVTELREAIVEAESESAARQAFIHDETLRDELIEIASTKTFAVEEIGDEAWQQ